MTEFEELRQAAVSMLKVNLNLRSGERVAFVSDVPSAADWELLNFAELDELIRRARMTKAFFQMARDAFPDCAFELICYPQTGQSGREPSEETARRFLNFDVLILMTTHSLSHTHARENASRRGARVASMPGVEAAMFAPGGPMSADYASIAGESFALAERLTRGQTVRITTPQGSDLRFSIAGRSGRADTGLFHQPGQFGNLPAGEAYIAPVEGSAVGRLVVPAGWFPQLSEDMTLIFEGGYVVEAQGGGQVGEKFRQLFDFGNESRRHRRNCAELGIGTNPNARNPQNVLEAEKIRGTVHIAVGDSSHLGGLTDSDLHEDFVLPQASVWVDEERILG